MAFNGALAVWNLQLRLLNPNTLGRYKNYKTMHFSSLVRLQTSLILRPTHSELKAPVHPACLPPSVLSPCIHAHIVGLGGSLVESIPVDRRVVGSNPCLAVGTLDKSFPHSYMYLWRFGVKLRHNIRAVSGAPLVIVDLKRRYRNIQNE